MSQAQVRAGAWEGVERGWDLHSRGSQMAGQGPSFPAPARAAGLGCGGAFCLSGEAQPARVPPPP